MEKYKWLDDYLMKQPGTERVFQPEWQAERYLLKGKMYAYTGIHDPSGRPIVTLKLEPAYSDMLRREHTDITPGYYMNKTHWSTVYLDGKVPQALVAEMAAAAYRTLFATLSKKAQKELETQA